MDRNARKIAFTKEFVKLCRSESALHEDDDLIELQAVEKVVELTVFFPFTELDIVLLKTV